MSHHVPAAWEEHEALHHMHEHDHLEHFSLAPERGWGITSSVHVHHEASLDFNATPDTEGAGMERPVGVEPVSAWRSGPLRLWRP